MSTELVALDWPQRPLELVTDRLPRYIAMTANWRSVHAV